MRASSAVFIALFFTPLGVASFVACESPPGSSTEPSSKGGEAQSATAAGARAAAIVTGRPQSAQYCNGLYDPIDSLLELEDFAYFYGTVEKGTITNPTATTTTKVMGRLLNGSVREILVTQDREDACRRNDNGSAIQLYRAEVEYELPDGGTEPRSLCANEMYTRYTCKAQDDCDRQDDPKDTGRRKAKRLDERAFAIPGYVDRRTGVYSSTCPGGGTNCFTLSCSTGVLGKCIHWGYLPWETEHKTPGKTMVDLSNYYQACIHAARAHYTSGEGLPHTCHSTVIDMFDFVGIQKREVGEYPYIESGWTNTGVLCLSHPRYQNNWPAPREPCALPRDPNYLRARIYPSTDAHLTARR
ncbi:MAG: hypothetical protein IPK82_31070 [Polyangiaceae bacterium]|nr:hypothetical protein [Polyangiaceae bacterium]